MYNIFRMLTARTADKYVLYRKSVQTPDSDARFLARYYRKMTGKPLRRLREDFCGTAGLVCEFVKLHRNNHGIGVDLDPEPLRWCADHLVPQLKKQQQSRVNLIRRDVTRIRSPKVELIAALNFSYSGFHKRSELIGYFKSVRRSLTPGGVFAMDAHGGREVPETGTETWNLRTFRYVWDVRGFDPASHRLLCRMHFVFPDGSKMRDAFVYDWRLWTLPELREALEDAGFRNQHILWETMDSRTGMGNGRMRRVERGRMEGAWYAMILCQA
ncbi:MAG TPA: class I SAM-dependent methyltransferase [Acidobacteriota bacterium]|nr:class I SAM-dependent methyltransferase [Acidobacteriota bacterium]